MNITTKSIDNIQLKITILVWMCVVLLSFGAFSALGAAIRARSEASAQADSAMPQIKRTSTPLTMPELAEIAARLSILHPGVTIAAVNGNLRVSISSEQYYNEWRAAIADIMASGTPDTVLETISMCGAACGGAYCTVDISANRVRYAVS